MATVECKCPLAVNGLRRIHSDECPNRRRGKGPQPQNYTGCADRPRTYSQARMAIEHLRNVLLRMAALDCGAGRPLMSPLTMYIADSRQQCETVRRYLDGE